MVFTSMCVSHQKFLSLVSLHPHRPAWSKAAMVTKACKHIQFSSSNPPSFPFLSVGFVCFFRNPFTAATENEREMYSVLLLRMCFAQLCEGFAFRLKLSTTKCAHTHSLSFFVFSSCFIWSLFKNIHRWLKTVGIEQPQKLSFFQHSHSSRAAIHPSSTASHHIFRKIYPFASNVFTKTLLYHKRLLLALLGHSLAHTWWVPR